MLAELRATDFQKLSITDRSAQLRELGEASFHILQENQLPNGLFTASVRRFDDQHFQGGVWRKDQMRAMQFAVDGHFDRAYPEKQTEAKDMYIKGARGVLQIQTHPEQLRRFRNRPDLSSSRGYHYLDANESTFIKFTEDGQPVWRWGHNQPDNDGTSLNVLGKGIEKGWEVLDEFPTQTMPNGQIISLMTDYLAGARVERLTCRSIWEREDGDSSYSTRRIALAGLKQARRVEDELTHDAKRNDYQPIDKILLRDAIDALEEKATEHFPADYTNSNNHQSMADMASLVVLNDVDHLPAVEQREIIRRTAELENRIGLYRYYGDDWKVGRAEAKWVMGKPIIARYYFQEAIKLYNEGDLSGGFRALDHGSDRMVDIIDILNSVGYIPELFEDKFGDGVYRPNNNELSWTHSYIVTATSAGIVAYQTSEKYYNRN